MYGTIRAADAADGSAGPPPPSISPFRYEVQKGDTLASIAERTNTTEKRLRQLNPMLFPSAGDNSERRRARVYPGQQLVVEDAHQVSLPPPPECIDNGWGQMHLVRPGDTLKSIAAQYNTTEELLRQDNRQFFPKGERGMLVTGQLMHVRIVNTGDLDDQSATPLSPSGYGGASAASSHLHAKYKTHKIRSKDTFESICKAYNITYARLLQINRGRFPVGARADLVVGEQLIVPDLEATEREASRRRNIAEVKLTKQIHEVERGETPESIAAMYHMTYDELREFNRAYFPKGYRGEIREGYKLVVKRVQENDRDEYRSIDGANFLSAGRSVAA